MQFAPFAWSSLLALAGSFSPPAGQQKWSPYFDYTNLQPSNEEYWEPLSKATVQLEQALDLLQKEESAPLRLIRGAMKDGEAGRVWVLELFLGGADGERPKRLNAHVSTTEPKVVKRLELLALAPEDEQAWACHAPTQVSAQIASELCKGTAKGKKEEPELENPRILSMAFVPVEKRPIWRAEMMGFDSKREIVRRFRLEVDATKPMTRQRIMMDRYPGEPLRKGQPTLREDGMHVYDFEIGDGEELARDSKITVNYRLFLLDNTKIHDTWTNKRTETFLVSAAPLKGMSEGLIGMRVGGRRKIAMPWSMAFGEKGNEVAPPKAMVICDVSVEELVEE